MNEITNNHGVRVIENAASILRSSWTEMQSKLPSELRRSFDAQALAFYVRAQNDPKLMELISTNTAKSNKLLLEAMSYAQRGLDLGMSKKTEVWIIAYKDGKDVSVFPSVDAYIKLIHYFYGINTVKVVALTDEMADKMVLELDKSPTSLGVPKNIKSDDDYTQAIAWCYNQNEDTGLITKEYNYFLDKNEIEKTRSANVKWGKANSQTRKTMFMQQNWKIWLEKTALKRLEGKISRSLRPVAVDAPQLSADIRDMDSKDDISTEMLYNEPPGEAVELTQKQYIEKTKKILGENKDLTRGEVVDKIIDEMKENQQRPTEAAESWLRQSDKYGKEFQLCLT